MKRSKAKAKAKAKLEPASTLTISGCHFEGPPAARPVPEHVTAAVKSVADACAANARALEKCAARLSGPDDYRTCMTIKDVGTGAKP